VAPQHLLKVFSFGQALYESVHTSAQSLHVLLHELGRAREASQLGALATRTRAKLGYALAPSAAEDLRRLVRASGTP
jgi:hypothetical protein